MDGCNRHQSTDEIRTVLEEDQLIALTEEGIEVKEKGRLFIRNICAAIDPLCKTTVGDGPVFSAAI